MVLTSMGSLLIVPPTLGSGSWTADASKAPAAGHEPRDRGRERGSYSLFAGKGTKLWAGSPWWGWSAHAWPAWRLLGAIVLRNIPETVQRKRRRQAPALAAAQGRPGMAERNNRPAAPGQATPVDRGAVPAAVPLAAPPAMVRGAILAVARQAVERSIVVAPRAAARLVAAAQQVVARMAAAPSRSILPDRVASAPRAAVVR